MLVVVFDVLRPKQPAAGGERNPWNAGTLEWLDEPQRELGRALRPARSQAAIRCGSSRICVDEVNDGRCYLPDAPRKAGARRMVTSVLDAEPMQVLRVAGPTFMHDCSPRSRSARVFIALTFHWWLVNGRLRGDRLLGADPRLALDRHRRHSRKRRRRTSGRGLDLPLYVSGPASVGWWAMFITMIGDGTAFASLIFGYFFYWTIHRDFPPGIAGPGRPLADDRAGAVRLRPGRLTLAARAASTAAATVARMRAGAARRGRAARLAGCGRRLLGPVAAPAWTRPPTSIPRSSGCWSLWTLVHAGVGVLMQLYCLAAQPGRPADARRTTSTSTTSRSTGTS